MNFDATPVSSNEVNAYQVEYKHFATVEILMCKLCKGVCSVACLNDEYGRIVNMLNDVRQPDTEREREIFMAKCCITAVVRVHVHGT